ncbi:unnamed protein product [Echinostoma caproni]|uniref:Uncharacterized protein n=1 Tax=Echinostoma caproni TaxID=27848 RepID=A0A3P8B8U4_9TREM|nr:unnamed protein product [Echinostoma caproni]
MSMLLRLLEHHQTKDKLISNLGETSVAVNLYTLIMKPLDEVDANAKKKTLQILHILLSSGRVPDSSRMQLFLDDYGGFASLMMHHTNFSSLLHEEASVKIFLKILQKGEELTSAVPQIVVNKDGVTHIEDFFK